MPPLTVEMFKRYVNVESDRDDDVLRLRLNAALGVLGRHTRRRFDPWPALVEVPVDPPTDPPTSTLQDTAAAVTFQRRVRNGSRFVRVPDVREITSVVVDGSEIETAEYWPAKAHESDPDDWPRPVIELARPGLVVDVTGRFGWVDFDDELQDAIYTVAAYRHYSAEAGMADAIRSAEFGDRVWLKQFPKSVQATLDNLVVPRDKYGLS